MIVSHYFNLFIVFSFIGWIYECTYCTVREKRWQNRGSARFTESLWWVH